MAIEKKLIVNGKRKTAIAKATIQPGSGKVFINKKPYENLDFFRKLRIEEPLAVAKRVLGEIKTDISINIKGGGSESQIEAARLAIARALLKYEELSGDKDIAIRLKNEFTNYDKNLLVADTRRKEANKPGDSKARSKRQKSFR